ncbi:hypothetical protein [Aurantiacibacter sediminis]|uniref:Uncharacterized protein n=1 Tax=Aurantiacibacter sediminis TaxID=2793064 RepID=A0ABS0N6P3_9SPHN|nr:hypothetical protein [Aurantiacibacter sediminis]MBH5323453.1 hypothetical protein [Aurantiacibacter sediminis]
MTGCRILCAVWASEAKATGTNLLGRGLPRIQGTLEAIDEAGLFDNAPTKKRWSTPFLLRDGKNDLLRERLIVNGSSVHPMMCDSAIGQLAKASEAKEALLAGEGPVTRKKGNEETYRPLMERMRPGIFSIPQVSRTKYLARRYTEVQQLTVCYAQDSINERVMRFQSSGRDGESR